MRRADSVQRIAYRKTGFTLVEMLMVMVLFLITGGGLITTFLTGRTSYLSSDAYIQVQQEARKAFDAMVRELREGGMVSCGTGAVTTTCTSPGPIARLNFQVAMGYNNAIQWGDGVTQGANNRIHYSLIDAGNNNFQLVRWTNNDAGAGNGAAPNPCTAGNNCRVLANNVVTADPDANLISSFAWEPSTRIVTLNLNVRYQNPSLPGGSQTTGLLTSRVKLRNQDN